LAFNETKSLIMNTLPPLLDVKPRTVPAFDPGFRPLSLAYPNYLEAARRSNSAVPFRVAVERENGLVSTFSTEVFPEGVQSEATALLAERIVKFLLWSRGGWRIAIDGPRSVAEAVKARYAPGGARAFDIEIMGRVYRRDFEVVSVRPEDFPAARESGSALGGHLDGCRIGFDLGASDFKIAAVRDGEAVFSAEIPWNPSEQADPAYHYDRLTAGLRTAAGHLPRVDAIGGSAAGIYIDNRVRIASLFRAVPKPVFEARVEAMFLRMAEEWGVPFEVLNDGEVTALAGTLSLGENAMLGVAMGSSQAAGYLAPDGHLPGWLDELAFVPVDISPEAPPDEWSGDAGVGALYFSQQAVNKLARNAGLEFPADMRLPERLKAVQTKAERGDPTALAVFDAIGVYLGYAIPWYAVFYDYRHLLVLGRVMSGAGGDRIAARAEEIVKSEFPGTQARVKIHLTDEKSRRVGQAVAAASLPAARPAPVSGSK
jgi:predicted NBD/HSP70 family sugar kinase